jgi:hypothetical protein
VQKAATASASASRIASEPPPTTCTCRVAMAVCPSGAVMVVNSGSKPGCLGAVSGAWKRAFTHSRMGPSERKFCPITTRAPASVAVSRSRAAM